jgi:hypothetical protein
MDTVQRHVTISDQARAAQFRPAMKSGDGQAKCNRPVEDMQCPQVEQPSPA